MAAREHQNNEKKPDAGRSSENIRDDIAKEKEDLSRTVDQIGERIKEKLAWREYVKNYPYLATGAAAGLGYLASRVFITRATPMERIMDSIAGEVRDSLSGLIARAAGPGLIKVALIGIATKAAARWIKNATLTDTANGERPRALTGPGPTDRPEGDA